MKLVHSFHFFENTVKLENGNIIDPLHKTIPFLTKYEYTRVLGQRSKQIEEGAIDSNHVRTNAEICTTDRLDCHPIFRIHDLVGIQGRRNFNFDSFIEDICWYECSLGYHRNA